MYIPAHKIEFVPQAATLELRWLLTFQEKNIKFKYSEGIGHLVGYNRTNQSVDYQKAVKQMCSISDNNYIRQLSIKWGFKRVTPKVEDILVCLVKDAEVLAMTFDDFKVEFGNDYLVYKRCKKNGIKLLQVFGFEDVQKLIRLCK